MSSTTSSLGGAAFSVYAASKAAVRNFARSWALDLKDRAIRVNAISPGPTRTPGLVGLVPAGQDGDLIDALAAEVPLGRVADPIASVALFLASPDASFVTEANSSEARRRSKRFRSCIEPLHPTNDEDKIRLQHST